MNRTDDLLAQWEEAYENGVLITPESLCADAPELLEDVRYQIQAILAIDREFGTDAPTKSASSPTPSAISIDTLASTQLTLQSRLTIERWHASGGSGAVFLGTDQVLNRQVAIKIPKRRHLDPQTRKRFEREATITGRLDHPGIIPVYAYQASELDVPCYVMRFVHGPTLQDKIRELHGLPAIAHGPNPSDPSPETPPATELDYESLAVRALLQSLVAVCRIVAYAHQQGIIHRDIKPSNVILGSYGEVVLADWGLAKPIHAWASDADEDDDGIDNRSDSDMSSALSHQQVTRTGGCVGTPAYASPEQMWGDVARVGVPTDVFALGATLFCLLTGTTPLHASGVAEGDYRAVLQGGRIPHARSIHSRIPSALDAICSHAMQTKPEDRYGSALEMADDLERFLAGEPPRVWKEPRRARMARWIRKHPAATAFVATALAITLFGANLTTYVLREKNQQLRVTNQRLIDSSTVTAQAHSQTLTALRTLFDDFVLVHLSRQPSITPSDREFLEQVLKQFEALAQIQVDSLEGQRVRGEGYLYSAKILSELGQVDTARHHLEQAIPILESLLLTKSTTDTRWLLVDALNRQSELAIELGDLRKAESCLVRGKQLLADWSLVHQADIRRRDTLLAELDLDHGYVAQRQRDWETADRRYQMARDRLQRLMTDHTDDVELSTLWADTHRHLMDTQGYFGNTTLQIQYGQLAERTFTRLDEQELLSIANQTALGWTHYDLSYGLESIGQTEQALQQNDRAIALFERMQRDMPSLAGTDSRLAVVVFRRGSIHRKRGEWELAVKDIQRSIEMLENLSGPGEASNPTKLSSHEHHQWLKSQQLLARTLSDQNQLDQAAEAYEKAARIACEYESKFPDFAENSENIAIVHMERAHVAMKQGRFQASQEAGALALQALAKFDGPNAEGFPLLELIDSSIRQAECARQTGDNDTHRHAITLAIHTLDRLACNESQLAQWRPFMLEREKDLQRLLDEPPMPHVPEADRSAWASKLDDLRKRIAK